MGYFPKGKHVTIDVTNPDALGICDYSRFVHNRRDLLKQMEWRGDALVWTGFYVGKTYLDQPNEQLRPPILPPDPVPIKDPRPMQPTILTCSNNYNIPISQLTEVIIGVWNGADNALPIAFGGVDGELYNSLKEERMATTPPFSNGTVYEPQLTQQQILQQLQQLNWSA